MLGSISSPCRPCGGRPCRASWAAKARATRSAAFSRSRSAAACAVSGSVSRSASGRWPAGGRGGGGHEVAATVTSRWIRRTPGLALRNVAARGRSARRAAEENRAGVSQAVRPASVSATVPVSAGSRRSIGPSTARASCGSSGTRRCHWLRLDCRPILRKRTRSAATARAPACAAAASAIRSCQAMEAQAPSPATPRWRGSLWSCLRQPRSRAGSGSPGWGDQGSSYRGSPSTHRPPGVRCRRANRLVAVAVAAARGESGGASTVVIAPPRVSASPPAGPGFSEPLPISAPRSDASSASVSVSSRCAMIRKSSSSSMVANVQVSKQGSRVAGLPEGFQARVGGSVGPVPASQVGTRAATYCRPGCSARMPEPGTVTVRGLRTRAISPWSGTACTCAHAADRDRSRSSRTAPATVTVPSATVTSSGSPTTSASQGATPAATLGSGE